MAKEATSTLWGRVRLHRMTNRGSARVSACSLPEGRSPRRATVRWSHVLDGLQSLSKTNSREGQVGTAATARPPKPRVNYVNKGASGLSLTHIVPALLRLSPLFVVAAGLTMYVSCCCIFAALFFMLGEDCFYLGDVDFRFEEMLWLSVHTWSSVGYGSLYPICASGQAIVLIESFCCLMITSVMSGRVFFEVMRPRARVRFSSNYLSAVKEDGYRYITFRLVRDSGTELRDATVRVQARFWIPEGPDGKMVGKRAVLPLENDFFNIVEQWQLWHKIDEQSPLWCIRDALGKELAGIEISLAAYDTSYMQEVRLYGSYSASDYVEDATFNDMLKMVHDKGGQPVLVIDFGQLDVFTATGRERPRRTFWQVVRRSTSSLSAQDPGGPSLAARSRRLLRSTTSMGSRAHRTPAGGSESAR